MLLRSLEHDGFRNLLPGRIEFGPGVNLFWGENGAGKSNLLEAVYFLFTTRSFRTQVGNEMVKEGAEGFRLCGEVEGRAASYSVTVARRPGGRDLLLDGKPVGPDEIFRRFSVLVVSSHQMSVLRGGPRDRRRFLDRGVLGLRPGYLAELGEFYRALAQRNQLIKGSSTPGERHAWDERFAVTAARVMAARASFTGRLEAGVAKHAADMLPPSAVLTLEYRPRLGGSAEPPETEQELRDRLLEGLPASAAVERRAGHTVLGPHRDDLRVRMNGRDVTKYGSAGQQRSALLALKITRLEMYREAWGEPPLLLVDDIDSDLDDAASERLLERARRHQALVATCRSASRDRFGSSVRSFLVSEGRLTRSGEP